MRTLTILVLLPRLGFSAEPVYLQALVATSGDGIAAVLDGEVDTSWRPHGDAAYEGVLFRFEEPTRLDRVRVKSCDATAIIPYVNTVKGRSSFAKGEHLVILKTRSDAHVDVRSLFLRFEKSIGDTCITEVGFELGGKPFAVKPPRSVTGKVEVSSTLAPEPAYHKSYLFDARLDFGWVEGVKGLGVGEKVTVRFDEPRDIRALEIWNGYQRSRDHFRKNARVTSIHLSFNGRKPMTLAVDDASGAQKIFWPNKNDGKGVRELVIEVAEAAKGSRYEDLVISELRFWDDKGPFKVRTGESVRMSKALQEKLSGKPLAKMVDRLWVSACYSRASHPDLKIPAEVEIGGRLKLRSNHTFAWYETKTTVVDAPSYRHEVFDGTWVADGTRKGWSTVKLYGRRNTVDRELDFGPYALVAKRERTRVSGGELQVARVEDLGPAATQQELAKWAEFFQADAAKASDSGEPSRIPVYYCEWWNQLWLDSTPEQREAGKPKTGEQFKKYWSKLVERSAILVKGRAITELLWQGE